MGMMMNLRRSQMMVTEKDYIPFVDPVVAQICADNWGDGKGITYKQAAAVTNIGTVFKGNTEITSFDEFENFINVQNLAASAFNGCSMLNSITLGKAVSIGGSAFYGCTALEIDDLSLPNLTSLGQNAFYGVKIKKISGLGKITALPWANASTQNFGDKSVLEEVVLPNTLTGLVNNAFYGYASLKSINLNGVTSIGAGAFTNCSSLTGILDLRHVTSFGSQCFSGCSGLEEIYIGEDVEHLNVINRYAKYKYSIDGVLRFPKLKTLSSAVFQSSLIKRVESLGEITDLGGSGYCYTFYDSTIEYCDIPSTCTRIGSRAFLSAKNLSTIVCNAIAPPDISSDTFGSNASDFAIYVPDASVDAYKAATNWSTYAAQIKPLSDYGKPTIYIGYRQNLKRIFAVDENLNETPVTSDVKVTFKYISTSSGQGTYAVTLTQGSSHVLPGNHSLIKSIYSIESLSISRDESSLYEIYGRIG